MYLSDTDINYLENVVGVIWEDDEEPYLDGVKLNYKTIQNLLIENNTPKQKIKQKRKAYDEV